MVASALAERGLSSKSASSPKYSPRAMSLSETRREPSPGRWMFTCPSGDDVHLAAGVALVEDELAGVERACSVTLVAKSMEVVLGETFEHRNAA